jgi:hypothetical protein
MGHTHTTTTREMREALQDKFDVSYDQHLDQTPRLVINNEKIISLIGPLIPVADTIVDTVHSLIARGAVQFPYKGISTSIEQEL